MKVVNIEELKKTDGSSYWQVTLPKKDGTPSKSPLVEWEKPTYNIGDELPYQVILMKPETERWYYKRREEATTQPKTGDAIKDTGRKFYGKTPEEQASIERQVDKKIAAELYRHHVSSETPFDKAELVKIYNACHSLGKNPVVEEAKKMGAVENE